MNLGIVCNNINSAMHFIFHSLLVFKGRGFSITESITEWLGLQGTSEINQFQPLGHGQENLIQYLKRISSTYTGFTPNSQMLSVEAYWIQPTLRFLENFKKSQAWRYSSLCVWIAAISCPALLWWHFFSRGVPLLLNVISMLYIRGA